MAINNLADLSITVLASCFAEATYLRYGTDEQAVFDILGELNRREAENPEIKHEFEKAVGRSVDFVLKDEMQGWLVQAEYKQALGLWRHGAPIVAGKLENFAEGFLNGIGNLFETIKDHPMAAGGILVAGVAVAKLGAAPLLMGAGIVIGVGMIGFGIFRAGQGLMEDDPVRSGQRFRDSGEDIAGGLMTLLPLAAARFLKGMAVAAEAEPAVQAVEVVAEEAPVAEALLIESRPLDAVEAVAVADWGSDFIEFKEMGMVVRSEAAVAEMVGSVSEQVDQANAILERVKDAEAAGQSIDIFEKLALIEELAQAGLDLAEVLNGVVNENIELVQLSKVRLAHECLETAIRLSGRRVIATTSYTGDYAQILRSRMSEIAGYAEQWPGRETLGRHDLYMSLLGASEAAPNEYAQRDLLYKATTLAWQDAKVSLLQARTAESAGEPEQAAYLYTRAANAFLSAAGEHADMPLRPAEETWPILHHARTCLLAAMDLGATDVEPQLNAIDVRMSQLPQSP